MTISEFSFLLIAVSTLAISIVAIVLARRLLPVLRQSELTLRQSRRTLRRLHHVTGELESMTHDARLLEGRLARTAHGVLDQVEPVMGAVRGLVAGARAGLGSLFSANGDTPGRRRGRHPIEREGARHE